MCLSLPFLEIRTADLGRRSGSRACSFYTRARKIEIKVDTPRFLTILFLTTLKETVKSYSLLLK